VKCGKSAHFCHQLLPSKVPLKTGAKGTTFVPCPESLPLIECGEFLTAPALVFRDYWVAQKIGARFGKQTSVKLAINLNFTVNLGRIKSENSLILRAS